MQEEASQKSSSEVSDETWERGAQVLEKLLPLQEAAFKRLSVDNHNTQLANARNYLWICVVLMTAGVAFFDRSELANGPLNSLAFVSMVLLALMFLGALSTFIRGIAVITGTGDIEPTQYVEEQIESMEAGLFSPKEIYIQRFNLSNGYVQGIALAGDGMQRRGRQLRLAGLDVRFSIGCGLGALLFYWLSRL